MSPDHQRRWTRNPGGREGTILLTVRVDGYLHRRRANAVLVILPDEGLDAGTATVGHSGGVAVLENDKTLFAVCVESGWVP